MLARDLALQMRIAVAKGLGGDLLPKVTFVGGCTTVLSGASWIHEAYCNASLDYRVVNAAEIDAPRIGHFGFFKARQQAHIWPVVSDWLDGQLGSVS